MELKGKQMIFTTCTVELPTSTGFHIVSCSMGGGKTTMINEICQAHAKQGILVVVQTIKDADELEQKITSKRSSFFSICKLHSSEVSSMDEYKKNPDKLATYDIVIITSARLIYDPPHLFTSYKAGFRKYILIDEMIHFYPKPFEITPEHVQVLTYVDKCKCHKGIPGEVCMNNPGYYVHCYRNKQQLKAAIEHYLRRSKTPIDEYRIDRIAEHIADSGLNSIETNIDNIMMGNCCILFDATADVIFEPSRLLPVTGKKYSSDIEFKHFQQTIKRKNNCEMDSSIIKQAQPTIDMISHIIDSGEKVLIVTWKTVDFFTNPRDDMIDNAVSIKTTSSFVDLIREALLKKVPGGTFDVIYRGSGADRASNEYRDYSVVVFWGEWRIPDTTAKEIGHFFNIKCSLQDYKLSLIIQTIGRLRIRQHKKLPIKVFFSDDIDFGLMYKVQEYFINNSESGCSIKGVPNPSHKHSKTEKKYLFDLAILCKAYPDIRKAVHNEDVLTKDITLDDLYKLIPKDRKEKNKYKKFLEFLRTKKINITIK